MADGLMSIFDRWTDLDPALALKRIEEAHGEPIFTKYSYLDPQRAVVEIEDALGIELDDTAFNFSQLEDDIDEALDTGGGDKLTFNAATITFDGAAVTFGA